LFLEEQELSISIVQKNGAHARRNVRDTRDAFFLFVGIVSGALLGFYGGIYGNWFYNTWKMLGGFYHKS
jgi:hypothetical protein